MNSIDVWITSILFLVLLFSAVLELAIFVNHISNTATIIKAQRTAILESDKAMNDYAFFDVDKNTILEGHLDTGKIRAKGECNWVGQKCIAKGKEHNSSIVRVGVSGDEIVWLVY